MLNMDNHIRTYAAICANTITHGANVSLLSMYDPRVNSTGKYLQVIANCDRSQENCGGRGLPAAATATTSAATRGTTAEATATRAAW